jgi:hypothetical protein
VALHSACHLPRIKLRIWEVNILPGGGVVDDHHRQHEHIGQEASDPTLRRSVRCTNYLRQATSRVKETDDAN